LAMLAASTSAWPRMFDFIDMQQIS